MAMFRNLHIAMKRIQTESIPFLVFSQAMYGFDPATGEDWDWARYHREDAAAAQSAPAKL